MLTKFSTSSDIRSSDFDDLIGSLAARVLGTLLVDAIVPSAIRGSGVVAGTEGNGRPGPGTVPVGGFGKLQLCAPTTISGCYVLNPTSRYLLVLAREDLSCP